MVTAGVARKPGPASPEAKANKKSKTRAGLAEIYEGLCVPTEIGWTFIMICPSWVATRPRGASPISSLSRAMLVVIVAKSLPEGWRPVTADPSSITIMSLSRFGPKPGRSGHRQAAPMAKPYLKPVTLA